MTGLAGPARESVARPGSRPAPSPRDMVEEIIDFSPRMRSAVVIGTDGRIMAGILRSGSSPSKPQRDEEKLCRQVARRRAMRSGFDRSLGRVRYIQVEREKVSQFAVYARRFTVYFTIEPEASIEAKADLVERVGLAAGRLDGP